MGGRRASLGPSSAGDDGRVIALAGDSGSRDGSWPWPTLRRCRTALLAADDNAALALGLVGSADRTVLFAEGVHGYGDSEGLSPPCPAGGGWRWPGWAWPPPCGS